MRNLKGNQSLREAFQSVPNWLTLFGLFTGFLSILMTSYGAHRSAACLILLAFLWDSMDGNLARAFGKTSAFGTQLDSLADLVSFIIAPCVLVNHYFLTHLSPVYTAVVFFYLVMGVFRLARFNLSPGQQIFFKGLPTTAAGFTIAAFTLTRIQSQESPEGTLGFVILIAMILGLGALMVSEIPYPKASSLIFRRWRFFLAADIACFLIASLLVNWETGFLAFALFFVLMGPVYSLSNRRAFAAEREFIKDRTGNLPA